MPLILPSQCMCSYLCDPEVTFFPSALTRNVCTESENSGFTPRTPEMLGNAVLIIGMSPASIGGGFLSSVSLVFRPGGRDFDFGTKINGKQWLPPRARLVSHQAERFLVSLHKQGKRSEWFPRWKLVSGLSSVGKLVRGEF